MINSPRSLQACKELGIIPKELYYISLEEYKASNPSLISLVPKALQMRYDGLEKIRKDSIALVKKRRQILISKENVDNYNIKRAKTEGALGTKSLEKMKEGEKKAIENLIKCERKKIKNIIEEQINKELLNKAEKKNEWKQQKREKRIIQEKKKMKGRKKRQKLK